MVSDFFKTGAEIAMGDRSGGATVVGLGTGTPGPATKSFSRNKNKQSPSVARERIHVKFKKPIKNANCFKIYAF